MSQRFASDTMRSAFSNPSAAVTFPGTTVRARTSISGEFSASIIAIASSVPGSVSMITFRGPAAVTAAATPKIKTAKQHRLNRTITQLPMPASSIPLLHSLPLLPFSRSLRNDNQRQPNQKARKHRRKITVRSLRRSAEFLPDEHAPERRHHRRALPESIGNRKSRATCGDNVEGHAYAQNNSAQNSRQMCPQPALEIISERNRRAHERLLHNESAQNKIANENAHRKNKDCRLRAQFPRLRVRKIRLHRRGHETVEEYHGDAASQRKNQALGADPRRAARQFSVGHCIQDNRQHHQQHPAKQQRRVALGMFQIIHKNAQHQRQSYPHGKRH